MQPFPTQLVSSYTAGGRLGRGTHPGRLGSAQLEVEVNDMGSVRAGGEAQGLVGLGGGAEQPAWVGSRLEAPHAILVGAEEGEAGGFLTAPGQLRDVHVLRRRGEAGEGRRLSRGGQPGPGAGLY